MLILKAKNHDEEAMDELLQHFKPKVIAISREYFLIGAEFDDLIQEGMIGLFKAVNSFNVDKNDNFSAYATMLIEREIISAIRRANTDGQHALSESIFIDNDDELGDNACPESDFIDEERTSALTAEIFKKLSAFEKVVADYFIKGYNYVDIAKITGETPKSIDNALSRIKKKLAYLKERL